MTLHDRFLIGERMDYGTHTFTAEAIIAFARKYDPQPFHTDPEAAKNSIFGALCASGWHTTAIWMQKNVAFRPQREAMHRAAGIPVPVYGPSPGIRNLKWPSPVYAGDTIRFHSTTIDARRRSSNPEWGIAEHYSEGFNQRGEQVLGFTSASLFRL